MQVGGTYHICHIQRVDCGVCVFVSLPVFERWHLVLTLEKLRTAGTALK